MTTLGEHWAGVDQAEPGWLLPCYVTLPFRAGDTYRLRNRTWSPEINRYMARDITTFSMDIDIE